jgi:hypothetical protein
MDRTIALTQVTRPHRMLVIGVRHAVESAGPSADGGMGD